jgi:tRNA-dihydrouridine synthase B
MRCAWPSTRGADGIMVGRGSFGQPWMFRQARALLEGEPMPATPGVEERFAVALDHARMVQAYEVDPEGAAIEFRKHLGWYVKGLPQLGRPAQAIARQVNTFAEVEGIFADYLRDREAGRHAEAADPADDRGYCPMGAVHDIEEVAGGCAV